MSYTAQKLTWTMPLARHVLPDSAFPPDLTLKPGYTYSFGFSLLVPSYLSPRACPEKIELHRRLPPSMGNQFENSFENTMEELSKPSTINYKITARVIKDSDAKKVVIDSRKFILVIPSYGPADLPGTPDSFEFSKALTHGMVVKKQRGSLRAVIAGPVTMDTSSSSPTIVGLKLYYTPVDGSGPPDIYSFSYKLKSYTIYSSSRLSFIPEITQNGIGLDTETLGEHRMDMSKQHWQLSESTKRGKNKAVVYCTKIAIPLSTSEKLSDYTSNSQILPTFFSCFISRRHQLQVDIHMSSTSGMSFKVPAEVFHNTSKSVHELEHIPRRESNNYIFSSRK